MRFSNIFRASERVGTSMERMLIAFFCLLLMSCSTQDNKIVRFGICADVHRDRVYDADHRLSVFVNEMNNKEVDFIIQLGDFCQPLPKNDTFMNIWNSFSGPAYHALGNHDMDGGFSKEETRAYYEMPALYYSFNLGGFHFIILDGNDVKDPPQKGYPHYIGEEQIEWLKRDINQTELPVIIFSHQSLEFEGGVENAALIRKIFEDINQNSQKQKVIACFAGHHHVDYTSNINGIYYIYINSMSYFWMGTDYATIRYSREIDEKFPGMKYTAPYEEPLFALVEIDSKESIKVKGRKSSWVGPDPYELNYPKGHFNEDHIIPAIVDRDLEYSWNQ